MWETFLWSLFFAALGELIRPKPKIENAKPAGLGEFNFPTATEGRKLPRMWGTVRIAGPNVVWWGDRVNDPITVTQKTGMFSSEEQVVGFKYKLGIQTLFCQGEVDELTRIWIGDDLVFTGSVTHNTTFTINKPKLFGGDDLGEGGVVGTWRFFGGTQTQPVSNYLEQFQVEPVTGDSPAYRGDCYIAPDTTRAYIGNTPSVRPWKVELRRTPNPLGLTSNRHIVNGRDANPMNVIYEIMVATSDGLGIASAQINTANFITAANTLHAEGNGFSFILDTPEDAGETLRRVEEQIDGIVYQNPATRLYEIKLARDDYDPLTIPELNATNIVSIRSFTQGTYEGTSNQITVPFADADDEYKETSARAQLMANVRIVGKIVPTTVVHPGIKNRDLANSIAWREARTLGTPLAKLEVVVDRSLYLTLPYEVLAFTWASPNATYNRLPMRVASINDGNLTNGQMVLRLVQDVFRASAGSFAPPPGSGWSAPQDTLVAYPVDQQVAFEAPRALTLRDPNGTDPYTDKIVAAARRQGPEVVFDIVERHAAGTPTGAFATIGSVYGFTLIGELNATLPVGSAYPLSTLTIVPTPDTQSAIETEFPDVTDLVELGNELLTLIMVDDGANSEFMLVSSAQTSGANVQLNGVYRGVLDSPQIAHAAGAPVYVLFVGAGISSGTVPAGQNVHVKLLPRSTTDALLEASATQIAFAMANRTRRPYPPSELSLGGTRFATTIDLEDTGTTEADGIGLSFLRRDFRTVDEVAALLVDAPAIFADFPAANSTTHEADVRNDPAGANTFLYTHSLGSGATGTIKRLDILKATDGVLPTRLRFALRSTHDFLGTSYDSRSDLVWDFNVTTALTGLFNFGALDTNDVSNVFTVANGAVDHVFALSSAFAAGDVEYRINGGAWTTLIAAGGTSGTIVQALLNTSDTIEVRHLSSDVGALKLLTMTVTTPAAYAVLFV